jgi:hypothetical protein
MSSTTLPEKKTRGAKKKSGFYHARWNTCGLNEQRAADVLGVTIEQVHEWDKIGNHLAERYLLLWDQKHVNLPGWDGFSFNRGVLCYKNSERHTAESLRRDFKARQYLLSPKSSLIDTTTEFRELRK